MIFRRSKTCLKRLLLVEDEPLVAFDNEYVLKSAGYEIVATIDRGEDAAALLAAGDIDAVITDINLAGDVSGRDVAMAAYAQGLAVMLVTGHCPEDAADYAHACLTKPYRASELVDGLRAIEDVVCHGKAPKSAGGMTVFALVTS